MKPSITCLLFMLLVAGYCRAQQVSPAEQRQIDIINAWVHQQMQEGHVPTAIEMDSINKAVKAMVTGHNNSNTAAKTTNIQIIAGATETVPPGKTWHIKRVFVTEGPGGRNVLVTSIKFNGKYKAGEKITAPGWSSESSLLTNDATKVTYIFEIEEK